MTIKAGDKVPAVKLKSMTKDGIKDFTTDDIFKGKKVAIFGLPGAFTPTCSAKHLPGFVNHYDALKAKGVDTVACVSVNDAFVMDAWGKAQNVGDKVMMLADGNADFAKALGIEMDGTGFGMGPRMKRFSMYVVDGEVKSFNLEKPGAFEVSNVETIGVAGMAFDPAPFDVVRFGRRQQRLPQIDVLDRFLVGGFPAAALPAMHPFGDAVAHVDAVGPQPHAGGPFERLERFDRRRQFHAVVGRRVFAARQFLFDPAKAQQRAPTAGTRIAAASAVGEDFDCRIRVRAVGGHVGAPFSMP
jgi:peroxiredoxin